MKVLEIEECQECHYHRNIGVMEICLNACHPKYDNGLLMTKINLIVKRIDPDCPLAEKEEV